MCMVYIGLSVFVLELFFEVWFENRILGIYECIYLFVVIVWDQRGGCSIGCS